MAIVEMQKLSLLAMREDKEKLLRTMQRMRCVQIRLLEGEEWAPYQAQSGADGADAAELQSRVRWTILELSRYGSEKKNLLASLLDKKPVLSKAQRDEILGREAELMEVVAETERCERRIGEARTADARIEAARAQLEPWQALRSDLSEIGDTRNTHSELVILPLKELEALRVAIGTESLPADIEIVSQNSTDAYLLVVYHRMAAQEMGELLRERGAVQAGISPMQGTVRQQLDTLLENQREVDANRDAIRDTLKALCVHLSDLKTFYDLLQARVARYEAGLRFAETQSTFYAQAWIPAPGAEQIRVALTQTAPTAVLEIEDPLEDEKPPTFLKNGRIVSNFEGIVKNFSMPDPHGIDPTFMMTPFFACFFGMMLSDAGYGIILALLLPLLIFVIKPKRGEKKMLWVLGIGGLFTIFWGWMFDTWFGASIKPMLLNPMYQPLEMMMLCLGVGAVHLFTGLGIAAYMNIKRKKPLDALFDQGFWVALLFGLAMLILPQTAAVGKWMAITGAVGIALTAGRAKKNVFSRLLGGFGALYNITGWISDLLSYARLFGMGLATGVIGMVINTLAGMVLGRSVFWTVAGVLVLIVGHVFNMAINTLGAYVHSCRLQYIEFFGKFYEDGGVPFKPLTDDTRYVDLSEVD